MSNLILRLVLSFSIILSPIINIQSSQRVPGSRYTTGLFGINNDPLQADNITLPFKESFTGNSISSGWIMGGNTILTGIGTIDPNGDGWLRLTGKSTYEVGYIYYNKSIPTNQGLIINFDYASWGGNGADGLTFFLYDGTTATFTPGANGGSLGYAQKCGINGVSNGYLGIGLDEFGNFSNPNECRVGGPGARKDSVVIRGPGSGQLNYGYVASSSILAAGIDTPGVTTRPSQTGDRYRHISIIIEPVGLSNRITVKMTLGYGTTPVTVIPATLMSFTSPATLKFGFAASTGGNTNYHEIRNLEIQPKTLELSSVKSVIDVNGGNVQPGDALKYSITIKNNSTQSINNIAFSDPIPGNTTYVPSSISIPSGSSLLSETPSIQINNISIPALSQVNLSYNVKINSPLDNGTIISNQAGIDFDADGNGTNETTINTDGDLVTSGEQPTLITIKSGPVFTQTTKRIVLTDKDGNGAASPGDVLTYNISLENSGDANANSILFTDVIPIKTTYVSGSPSSSSGSAPSYNTTTRTVQWTGSISSNSHVTLSFAVTINSTGVQIRDVISNQGQLQYDSDNNGSRDSTQLTDSDLTQPGEQPAEIMIGGRPEGVAIKSGTDINGGNLEPGDIILYTILMQNLSNYDSNNMEFIDAIPNSTSYVANSISTPSGSSIITTSPILDIRGISVPAHSSLSVAFKVKVDDTIPSGINQIENQGLVYYDSNNDGTNDSSEATDGDTSISGYQPTILSLTAGSNFSTSSKEVALHADVDGNQVISPGDTLRYALKINNTGNQDATGVSVRDRLPNELNFVVGSLDSTPSTPSPIFNDASGQVEWDGDIPAGSIVIIHFQTIVKTSLPTGTIINNQGTVIANNITYPTDGDASQPGSQVTSVTLGGQPQGIAIKSATDLNGGNLEPGDQIRFDIVLSNLSSYDSLNIELTDSIPNFCEYIANSLSIPSGASIVSETPLVRVRGINVFAHSVVNLSFKVKVVDTVPDGVSAISNQGVVFYDSDGNGYNDSFQQTDGNVSIVGQQPTILSLTANALFTRSSKQVELINDADGNGFVSPGDSLSYSIVLNNSGNQDATGVEFQDAFPEELTFVNGSLSTTAAAPAASYTGGSVRWNGDIPALSTITIQYTATVNAALLTGTEIQNQGIILADGIATLTDANPSLPGNQPTTIKLGGLPQGLAIKRAIDLNYVNLVPGDVIRYEIELTNQSNYDALNMELSDTAPAQTKIIPTSISNPAGTTIQSTENILHITGINLLAKSQVFISFNVLVNSTIPDGVTEISNQGVIFYDSDGNGTNDTSQLTDGDLTLSGNQPTIMPIIAGANFEYSSKSVALVVDSDGNGLVSPGDTLEYTVYLSNMGDQNASQVKLVDKIPFNTSYVMASATATSGSVSYQNGNQSILWEGAIAAGDETIIKFRVLIDLGLNPGVAISNQGLVYVDSSNGPLTSTDGDTQLPGKQPTKVVIGGSVAGFALKTAEDINGGSLEPGDIIRYNLKLKNTSTFPAVGLEFVDPIPLYTSYVVSSLIPPIGPNVSVVSTSPNVRITGIDVPPLSELDFSFEVKVNSSIPAGITHIQNQGIVYYDTDGNGINDASQQTDSNIYRSGNQSVVMLLQNLFDPPSVYKSFSDTGFPVLVWRQVWINDGNTSSELINITDTIPIGTTYVADSIKCLPHGSSVTYSCTYQQLVNQIQFTGIIGADPGAVNEYQADNEVIVEFSTLMDPNTLTTQNQAHGFWDQNGDGVVDTNDENFRLNQFIVSDDPGSIDPLDATVWVYDINKYGKVKLPKTGFAPNTISSIAPQPLNMQYKDMNEIQIEIPKIGVTESIVEVPFVDNQWDVSWLSNQIGFLAGTAFPTWSGNSYLTGHLTLPNGKQGPLYRLYELKWGDKIIIHAWDQNYIFEVREISEVNVDQDLEIKHTTVPWITLITCKDFDEAIGVYHHRIIVSAVLISITEWGM